MESLETVERMNISEFGRYLAEEGIHKDIIVAFAANRICGSTFLKLNEEDLKELIPLIGDRIRVRELQNKAREVIVLLFCRTKQRFPSPAVLIGECEVTVVVKFP